MRYLRIPCMRRYMSIGIGLPLVILVISASAIIVNMQAQAQVKLPPFHDYRDPRGYFTISIPEGGNVEDSPITQGLDGPPNVAVSRYNVTIIHPQQTGIVIFLNVEIYPDNPSWRAQLCQNIQHQTSDHYVMIDGITAEHRTIIHDGHDAYFMNTNRAYYQLGYRATLWGHSEAADASSQQIYDAMVRSFTMIPATPLACAPA